MYFQRENNALQVTGIKFYSGLAAAETYHLKGGQPKVEVLMMLLSFNIIFGSEYNTVKLLPHYFSVKVFITNTLL
jgi:hypothetical protein